ncbi:hypothetical protein LOTGIDRAFT_175241 [Lottia gigantea]|uniref:Uncharacterized protein n=1 Tax=Lottia gigantea TaxID=225164 RepID=V3ZUM2_LOTGI|nr:hypothetical protein LOTGIDRAFT_175241 [Lottia gigantea]ESO95188.1 hypothetical protein LOTGIDRAFT_175241 [Lottia gigantea]
MDSMFIRKNANCFLLFELNDKDLSQIIQSINHGMDRDAFKKVCKAQWKNPDDYGYVFVNTRKPAGERVIIDDWNNILKRNREYVKAKNNIKTQVENNKLQQLGLTENLQTLFQPILKSQEGIKKRLITPIEPIAPIEPPKAIEYDGIIIRTIDDINRLFSNPKADLPKSITPIIDDEGLLFNGFRIKFRANSPIFKIDTKNLIFTLTTGLIDLMNGGRFKTVETYLNKVIPDEEESDDYAEDYPPIIQEIDEFEDMVSGEGITFLSDNNEELLNRLRLILAAMKEGHRSHRQYNEVNCILKRLLEKGIIDKNDYKSVIKNVK